MSRELWMYPEDRVLIAYLPEPDDFQIIKEQGWYRIPEKHAPKGLHAEYFAFYFGSKFGQLKWSIYYYAEQRGYELLKRADLFPEDTSHPRANDYYYKVALGPLQKRDQPITSLRWRRITFMHTTWDRFTDAREIGDLLISGGEYVDRIYSALKERGIPVERERRAKEAGGEYNLFMTILCKDGVVEISEEELNQYPDSERELIDGLAEKVRQMGGAVNEYP